MGKTVKVAKKLIGGYNIVVKQKDDKLFAAYSPYAYPHEIELKRVMSIKGAVWYFKERIRPRARSFSALLTYPNGEFAARISINAAEHNAYDVQYRTRGGLHKLGLVCILEDRLELFMNEHIAAVEKMFNQKFLIQLDYKTYHERKQEQAASNEKENSTTCV